MFFWLKKYRENADQPTALWNKGRNFQPSFDRRSGELVEGDTTADIDIEYVFVTFST